jgi:large subunit ribosomal protein L9
MKKVILQESISHLGKAGEIVRVKDGYARNYLLPRKLALLADERYVKQFEHQKKLTQHRMDKILDDARGFAQKVESISCTISRKAGEEDQLFGSVTDRDIEEALKKEGIEVDRKNIQLAEPIKILGVFTVPIKVHKDVTANLKLWVVKDD